MIRISWYQILSVTNSSTPNISIWTCLGLLDNFSNWSFERTPIPVNVGQIGAMGSFETTNPVVFFFFASPIPIYHFNRSERCWTWAVDTTCWNRPATNKYKKNRCKSWWESKGCLPPQCHLPDFLKHPLIRPAISFWQKRWHCGGVSTP